MNTYPIPLNEEQRLQELYALNILDTEEEQDFTDIVELASYICRAPISLITLVDRKRQWFKAQVGISDKEMDRQTSICSYTILGKDPFIVSDASKDRRFAEFSTVRGDPHVRFYAGIPLVSNSGYSVGSLCVIDNKPRMLDLNQQKALTTLATQVIKLLEERARGLRHKERARLEQLQNLSLERLMQTQRRILTILGHDARAPLYAINHMLRFTAKKIASPEELEEDLELITNQLSATLVMIEDLLTWGKGHLELETETNELSTPVRKIVEDVMKLLYANAHLKGIELNNHADETVVTPIPTSMLSFIIRNLLNNAIKFTSKGSVTVEVQEENDEVIVTVSDTGAGMTEQQVAALNNRFISDGADTVSAGSGIGIIMIQEFLLQLDGQIVFSSGVSEGTRVEVRLPKPPAQAAIPERAAVSK